MSTKTQKHQVLKQKYPELEKEFDQFCINIDAILLNIANIEKVKKEVDLPESSLEESNEIIADEIN